MRIGDLAEKSGLSTDTLRYYEKIGLLPEPDRDSSGYRSYRNAHLDRLLFIKRCRNLDMAQDEIRELIGLAVDTLHARHLTHVRERLRELASLEETLVRLQKACTDGRTVRECGILGELNSELGALEPEERHNHVPGTHGPGQK